MRILGGHVPVDYDLSPIMRPVSAGVTEQKTLVVVHETVSGDSAGIGDILSPARYLAAQGYGVHGIIDEEAHIAWAYGMRKHILFHAASSGSNVNTRSIGIELVSRAPALKTREERVAYWNLRTRQLDALAKLLAVISRIEGIPLRYSQADTPGITSHWDVSETYNVPGGHWDCKPRHKGGHFPLLYCIYRARQVYEGWYTSTDI